MKARRLFHKKQRYKTGIVEMVLWRLPKPDANRPHGFKYRLVYVRDGMRLVGYDNESGKGDHRHLKNKEEPYNFRGVRQLVRDFWQDIRRCGDDEK